MSLKRIFKFAKPKTPGYGIANTFYLSILSGHPQLPRLNEILNPAGEGGAIEGYIAPLRPGAEQAELNRPLERGVYALASPDRKTVVRLRVISKEEAGFDPELVARSALAMSIAPEAMARIRATWTLLQLTFESHDAMVAPALRFLFRVAKLLAERTEGVVADPMAQRYLLPAEVPVPSPQSPIEAVDHVSVRHLERDGKAAAFTLGMQKFGLPEWELNDVPAGQESTAAAFLLSLCQTQFSGTQIKVGDRAGGRTAPFDVVVGGIDRTRWEGIPVWEVLPGRGKSVAEGLRDWLEESSNRPG